MRRIIWCFKQTDGWWDRIFDGYTHVFLIELISPTEAILFEPRITGLNIKPINLETARRIVEKTGSICVNTLLEGNYGKLFQWGPQTCATVCQYVAGINLGTILVNPIYEKLIGNSLAWHHAHGIFEVNHGSGI